MGEFIEQLSEGFSFALVEMAETLEGREGLGLAELEDHSRARDPIDAFGVEQVGDDVDGSPRLFSLIACGPGVGQAAQQRIENSGRVREKGERAIEIEVHWRT